MKTWHERLQEALAARDKTQAELARHASVKPPSVSDWLNGKTRMLGGKNAAKVCDFLRINHDWLFYGRLPSGLESDAMTAPNVRPAQPDTRRIPVLNKIPAGGPKQIIDDYLMGTGLDDIATDLDLGRYAFALIIDGASMEPEFKTGDKVIIDPGVKPRPGDYVVAKCNGDEGTFKKYRPRGLNQSGIEMFELVPLNDDFPTLRSEDIPCEIIGTMVEHRRLRRT